MTSKNSPEGTYEQTQQRGGAVEPLVYEKRLMVSDFFYILLKRKWIPIASLVTFVAIVAIASHKATRMYKATTKIEIEKGSLNLLSFQDVVKVDTTNVDYYNTQYEILKTKSLAETVAAKLRAAGTPQDAKLTRDDVLKMTEIEPVAESRLVDITAESRFPEQAAAVANTLAEAYIQQDVNKKVESIRMATEKLGAELTKAKARLDKSEKEFIEYKEQNNIVSLNERQNLVLEQLSKLNEAAAASGAEKLRKEARYNELKVFSLDELKHEDQVAHNAVIQDLKTLEIRAVQNVESLAKIYGKKHPKLISAETELAKAQEAIDIEISKIIEGANNSYLIAKGEEEHLKAGVQTKKKEVLEFTRRVNRYEGLSREVETNKRLYNEILNRTEEAGISQRTEETHVRIVDRADIPKKPFKPRTLRNLILAIIAGLVVGCGGALSIEFLNDKVEDPDDILRFFAKPFLGAVPIIKGEEKHKAKAVHHAPKSTTSQAYKTILASIRYSPGADGLKSILVTSAGPREGKTTTVTNLGTAAAQTGKRVLLVDTDLWKPTLDDVFGLTKNKGFTDYLIGEARLADVVQETDIPNLYVISGGTSSPDPSGLLTSERMNEFTELIRDKFDLILFDSPPCTVISDALTLANVVDGVINVTYSGKFSRKMVGRAIDLLDGVDANVLGLVLNEVKERDRRYYSYYRYGYSYYGKGGDRRSGKGDSRKRESKR